VGRKRQVVPVDEQTVLARCSGRQSGRQPVPPLAPAEAGPALEPQPDAVQLRSRRVEPPAQRQRDPAVHARRLVARVDERDAVGEAAVESSGHGGRAERSRLAGCRAAQEDERAVAGDLDVTVALRLLDGGLHVARVLVGVSLVEIDERVLGADEWHGEGREDGASGDVRRDVPGGGEVGVRRDERGDAVERGAAGGTVGEPAARLGVGERARREVPGEAGGERESGEDGT
jgi:hypothetical protein